MSQGSYLHWSEKPGVLVLVVLVLLLWQLVLSVFPVYGLSLDIFWLFLLAAWICGGRMSDRKSLGEM